MTDRPIECGRCGVEIGTEDKPDPTAQHAEWELILSRVARDYRGPLGCGTTISKVVENRLLCGQCALMVLNDAQASQAALSHA